MLDVCMQLRSKDLSNEILKIKVNLKFYNKWYLMLQYKNKLCLRMIKDENLPSNEIIQLNFVEIIKI